MDQILAGLGNRVFLMNNTHEDQPVILTTRWALSYLRGPLTRSQIKTLMDPYKAAAGVQPGGDQGAAISGQQPAMAAAGPSAPPAFGAAVVAAMPVAAGAASAVAATTAPSAGVQPTLAADIPQYFIPIRGSSSGVAYQPALLGAAKVRYADSKAGVDETQDVVYTTPITDRPIPVDWAEAQEAGFALNDLERTPARGAAFGDLPAMASKSRSYADWSRDFVSWAYGSQKLELLRSPSTGQVSAAGESERDFRVRLQQATREQRDDKTELLRKKYAPKIAILQERIRKAEQAVNREADQAKTAGMQTALSFGSTLLGAFLGRKALSSSTISKAATSMKGVSRTAQQQGDVGRAKETVDTYKQQLDQLNAEFEAESQALESKIDPSVEQLEQVVFRPKKTDINVQLVSLVWAPYFQDDRGKVTPAW
jgi:hypothetical protein